jgi:hypothetical protein
MVVRVHMADPDQNFRLGVTAGGTMLVMLIIFLRFCGGLSLPPKPAPPTGPEGTSQQLLTRSTASPEVYRGFLQRDAQSASLHMPTMEDMSRKFPYRVDEARHVLEPGKPAIEVAGLRLRLDRAGDQVDLVIQNLIESDVAYEVSTTVTVGASVCNAVRSLPYNAMVLEKGGSETRTECGFRAGIAVVVTKVETIEVPRLSAWYLSQVPPTLVGTEDRLARGHHGVQTSEPCSSVQSAMVKAGMDRGEITWRDLADFYARHRCQSYPFPSSYRAFKADGEHQLPVTDTTR